MCVCFSMTQFSKLFLPVGLSGGPWVVQMLCLCSLLLTAQTHLRIASICPTPKKRKRIKNKKALLFTIRLILNWLKERRGSEKQGSQGKAQGQSSQPRHRNWNSEYQWRRRMAWIGCFWETCRNLWALDSSLLCIPTLSHGLHPRRTCVSPGRVEKMEGRMALNGKDLLNKKEIGKTSQLPSETQTAIISLPQLSLQDFSQNGQREKVKNGVSIYFPSV